MVNASRRIPPAAAAAATEPDRMTASELVALLTEHRVSDSKRLARLLAATRVPNPALVPDTSARLLQFSADFPWFLHSLFPGAELTIARDLGTLAGPRLRTFIPVPESASSTAEFKTLFRGPLLNEALDPLRSVLILARVASDSDWLGRRIARSHVLDLSSRIRAIAFRGGAKVAGSALTSLKGCKELSKIRDAVTNDLINSGEQSTGFGITWNDHITPFLNWLLRTQNLEPGDFDPIPEEPAFWNPPKIPWKEPDPFNPEDFGPELTPVGIPIRTPPGKLAPSPKTVAAFSDQALRGRNNELIVDPTYPRVE